MNFMRQNVVKNTDTNQVGEIVQEHAGIVNDPPSNNNGYTVKLLDNPEDKTLKVWPESKLTSKVPIKYLDFG